MILKNGTIKINERSRSLICLYPGSDPDHSQYVIKQTKKRSSRQINSHKLNASLAEVICKEMICQLRKLWYFSIE